MEIPNYVVHKTSKVKTNYLYFMREKKNISFVLEVNLFLGFPLVKSEVCLKFTFIKILYKVK